MTKKIAGAAVFLCLWMFGISTQVRADSEIESNFKDMFVTAGYSAAAGAAVGAALLTFQEEPLRHLKFMSVGASLGFLGGMSVGSWMVIAPIFVDNKNPAIAPALLAQNSPRSHVVLRPWLDVAKNTVSGLEAGLVFASF